MTEQHLIKTDGGSYEMHVLVCVFDDDNVTGEQVIGPVDYMWGRDGSETLEPSKAVKVTTQEGEEIILTNEHWLRCEISQNSLWQDSEE